MRPAKAVVFAALTLQTSLVGALRVATGSPCSSKCGNVLDSTEPENIVCDEGGFSSGDGLVFKNCVTCESRSSYVTESATGKETDVQWLVYNLRYAAASCLYGFPDGHAESNPCLIGPSCEPLKQAVIHENMAANVSTYDYCAAWQPLQLPKCLSCLSIGGGNHFLRNYLTVLGAACEQQPLAGKVVGIEGDIFSTDIVNGTDITAIPTLSPDYFKEGSFGLGAKVGVAFGSLAFLLIVAGFLIVCIGKRKRRSYLRQLESRNGGGGGFGHASSPTGGAHAHKSWAGHLGGSSSGNDSSSAAAAASAARGLFDDTPMSQKPLRGWDDSPMSATTEKAFPRYISPYSSQFSSPVSAGDAAQHMPWPPGGPLVNLQSPSPHEQGPVQHIGLALGGDDSSIEVPSPAKGKGRAADGGFPLDGFHEEDVYGVGSTSHYGSRVEAPVLQHPGYGRSSESLPRRYQYTGEEARRDGGY